MKKIISFEKKLDFKSMIGEVSAISLDHTLKFISENSIEGDLIISGRYKLTEASILEESFDYKIPVDILLNETLDLETSKIDIEDFYYEIENECTLVCHIEVKVEGVEKIEEELTEETKTLEEVEIEVSDERNTSESTVLEKIDVKPLEEKEGTNKEERSSQQEIIKFEEENKEEKIPESEERSITPEESTDRNSQKPKEIQDDDDRSKKSKNDSQEKQEESSRECDGDLIDEKDLDCEIKKSTKGRDEIMESEVKEEQNTQTEVGSLFSSFKESDETFSSYSVYIIRENETVQSLIEKYKTTKEDLENYNDLSNLSIGSKIIIPSTNE